MISIFWLFVGAVTGLLLVSVFSPPARNELKVPTPADTETFHTHTGCVKIRSKEVACSPQAISLNLLASQHK
jgi:hypothetical protein